MERGIEPAALTLGGHLIGETPSIVIWLSELFDDDHIDETCSVLEEASGPDLIEQNRQAAASQKIAECDSKLAKYRQALEAGTDPDIVGEWAGA